MQAVSASQSLLAENTHLKKEGERLREEARLLKTELEVGTACDPRTHTERMVPVLIYGSIGAWGGR